MRPALWLALAAVALIGGVGPASAKQAGFTRPAYVANYEPQGVDERGQWKQADDAERLFRDSPGVIHDPALTGWIHGVLCRAVGDDRCAAARVYVVRDASFNASMAPNGMLLVHTGLLLRLHSEAELAAVLGHEFGHFEKRHSVAAFRARRKAGDILAWVQLAGAVASQSTIDLQQAVIASYFSFNRAQESEADAMGAQYLAASPYRLHTSSVWVREMDEDDASRVSRGLRPRSHGYTGWLDSHPPDLQRARQAAAAELLAGNDGEEGAEAYRRAIAPLLPEMLDGLVHGNDFGAAEFIIRSQGEEVGWTGQLLYARGELYRLRGNPRDLVSALGYFRDATKLPDAPAEAWRGLGLCAWRIGERPAGQTALNEYLRRRPDAVDAALIHGLLES